MKMKLVALCLSLFAGSSAFAVPNHIVLNAVNYLINMRQSQEVEACHAGRAYRTCLARNTRSFLQGDFWVVRFSSPHACAFDVFVDRQTSEVSDALSSMSWGCAHTNAYVRDGVVSPGVDPSAR